MNYVASLSCGKDSLAMVLRLMEENRPLTHVVMYDTGMEFQPIYNVLEKIKPIIKEYGAELTVLKPKTDFYYDMLVKPKKTKDGQYQYGYEWCGRMCRWRTSSKVAQINSYLQKLGEYTQYIGIAVDEPKRIRQENNKIYPLVEWNMTEADCLEYCYSHGWNWEHNGIDLYQILDRVSCWCCWNKNLKELRNIRKYLPDYWQMLLGLQSRIDRPFKDNASLFDLDKRFEMEDSQMDIFEFMKGE